MRKLLFIALFLTVLVNSSLAQQDPHFSQFMFNKSYWSSALTAIEGKSTVSLLSRAQWLGYEPTDGSGGSPPSTQFINFSTPVMLKSMPLGLGINIIYDKLGELSNFETQLSFAYHKSLKKGTLSIGLRPSVINQTLDFSKLKFNDQRDRLNVGTKESQMAFDLGAGLAYSTKLYLISIGVSHLLRPKFFDYGVTTLPDSDEGLGIIYNLYGQYDYTLTYNIDLTPSVLVKTDIVTYSLDLGVVATYNKKMWGGLTYRNAESIVFLFGYSFLEDKKLRAGYSFDYVIKERSAKQATSHEIFLSLDLPSFATGSKKIIRTPRFRY